MMPSCLVASEAIKRNRFEYEMSLVGKLLCNAAGGLVADSLSLFDSVLTDNFEIGLLVAPSMISN